VTLFIQFSNRFKFKKFISTRYHRPNIHRLVMVASTEQGFFES